MPLCHAASQSVYLYFVVLERIASFHSSVAARMSSPGTFFFAQRRMVSVIEKSSGRGRGALARGFPATLLYCSLTLLNPTLGEFTELCGNFPKSSSFEREVSQSSA